MNRTQRLQNLKKQNCTNILIVASCEHESLFIVRHGHSWRFTNGDSESCVSFVGREYSSRNEIKFAAYDYAKHNWGFSDDEISDWAKGLSEMMEKSDYGYKRLTEIRKEAETISKSDESFESKFNELLAAVMSC
ncbi:hypothetical protein [Aeromonas caviae]|uniref:hypothetical protein n=1 Tax=Aeromonas caviae TaxID=648 RepID=UPI00385EE71F